MEKGYEYNTGRTDDDELLIPPAEEFRRARWDMNPNPYQQTPRFYDEPMLDVNSGYPRQQMNAMNSSVSNNVVVVQPSHSSGAIYEPVHVPDYTWLSVFVSFFCCLALGICALKNARDAKKKIQQGKMQEALDHSKVSRNLNITAMIVGPILITVTVLLYIYLYNVFQNDQRQVHYGS